MGDYNLSGLNPREFEHLVQALALAVIAPGVTPFGDGPDGGREAIFRGRMAYPSVADPWEGYLVIQAKFRQRPAGDPEVMRQLQGQQPDFESMVSRFLQIELRTDLYSRLEQAGHTSDDRIPLARVFVDLPAADNPMVDLPMDDDMRARPGPGLLADLLQHARQILKPSLATLGLPRRTPVRPYWVRNPFVSGVYGRRSAHGWER